MEEAQGFQTLMAEHGLTQEEVAERVGKSRPAVANALRLLALPLELQAMVENGTLSGGHARTLLPLKRRDLQLKAARQITEQGLSVRQTEQLVKRMLKAQEDPVPPPAEPLSIYMKEAEKELSLRFGRKARIISGRKKGRLELEFYSMDDLDALLSLLETIQGGKGGSLT